MGKKEKNRVRRGVAFDEIEKETLIENCDLSHHVLAYFKSHDIMTVGDILKIDRSAVEDRIILANINILRMAIGRLTDSYEGEKNETNN